LLFNSTLETANDVALGHLLIGCVEICAIVVVPFVYISAPSYLYVSVYQFVLLSSKMNKNGLARAARWRRRAEDEIFAIANEFGLRQMILV